MIREYGFEKLIVWKNARKLVKDIYCLTRSLPAEERYGLTSQIQRASVSVGSNIVEGASRQSSKDQAHFYQMAYASLMEVLCQLTLCLDLAYIDESGYFSARELIDVTAFQLTQLRNAAKNKHFQPSQPSQLSQLSQPSQP
jgi:four helix bundle protein